MGLNESYAPTCGKIFLMDPLPQISKVFSLVFQEEHQHSINSRIPSLDPMFGN